MSLPAASNRAVPVFDGLADRCYPAAAMDAVIISIGTELTTGQNVDTNSAWLSAERTRLGVRVVGHMTVDDDVDRARTAV